MDCIIHLKCTIFDDWKCFNSSFVKIVFLFCLKYHPRLCISLQFSFQHEGTTICFCLFLSFCAVEIVFHRLFLCKNTEVFTSIQCEPFSFFPLYLILLGLDRLNSIQSGYILDSCIWNACFFCIMSLKWKCLLKSLSSQMRIFPGIFSFISL